MKESSWVKVKYEGEWFLCTVQKNAGKDCLVRCLAKPYGVREPQEMEPESDAVYYDDVYDNEGIVPKLMKVKRSWKWIY